MICRKDILFGIIAQLFSEYLLEGMEESTSSKYAICPQLMSISEHLHRNYGKEANMLTTNYGQVLNVETQENW